MEGGRNVRLNMNIQLMKGKGLDCLLYWTRDGRATARGVLQVKGEGKE
jgi:hypothetical protein